METLNLNCSLTGRATASLVTGSRRDDGGGLLAQRGPLPAPTGGLASFCVSFCAALDRRKPAATDRAAGRSDQPPVAGEATGRPGIGAGHPQQAEQAQLADGDLRRRGPDLVGRAPIVVEWRSTAWEVGPADPGGRWPPTVRSRPSCPLPRPEAMPWPSLSVVAGRAQPGSAPLRATTRSRSVSSSRVGRQVGGQRGQPTR
jgi:hypothetical protein